MEIRTITHLDVERVVSLGRRMASLSPRAEVLGFDEARFRGFLHDIVDSTLFANFVACAGDEVVGFLIAMVGQLFPFSHEIVAHEELFFVDPEHRRTGRAAIRLIEAFFSIAREREAVQIEMRNATGYRPEIVERFYQSRGLRRVGALFVMEV